MRPTSIRCYTASSSRGGRRLGDRVDRGGHLLLVHGTAILDSSRVHCLGFCDALARLGGRAAIGHSVDTERAGVAVDGLHVETVVLDVSVRLVQDLAESVSVLKGLVLLSRHDWCVVEVVEDLACSLGQDNLLLGALNDGGSVDVKGLLELLAGDVGQLRLGDERLCLVSDKLLLKLGDLGGRGLLVLELGDLVKGLQSVSLSLLVS